MALDSMNRSLLRRQNISLIAVVIIGLTVCAQVLHAGDYARYAVARMMIYPGDRIVGEMLEEKELKLPPPGQALASLEQALGKISRRTLAPGQAIPLNALREPDVVRSGKSVALIFSSHGLTITGRGIALQSGASGDTVAVQNVESNVVVRGRVRADGTVWFDD